jgi:hypothetical protein
MSIHDDIWLYLKNEEEIEVEEIMSHPGFRGPKPGREHNHQVCWDQVSHI